MSFLQAVRNQTLFESYLALRGVEHRKVSTTQIEFHEEGQWWSAEFLSDGRLVSVRPDLIPASYGLHG